MDKEDLLDDDPDRRCAYVTAVEEADTIFELIDSVQKSNGQTSLTAYFKLKPIVSLASCKKCASFCWDSQALFTEIFAPPKNLLLNLSSLGYAARQVS